MKLEDLKPTKEQNSILEKAIELLRPFDKEKTADGWCYFTDKDDDEIGSEYDCCGNDDCVKKMKKSIRKSYGNRKEINENHTYDSGDNDKFCICHGCGAYLNNSLSWIKDEIGHHEEHSKSADDFKISSIAFELIVIFESIQWSLDYRITAYTEHQYSLGNEEPLGKTLKWQKDLINRVVKHAQLVIDSL